MDNEMMLYHSSNSVFKKFNANKVKRCLFGWGLYFSTYPEGMWGEHMYTVEVPDDINLLEADDMSEQDLENLKNKLIPFSNKFSFIRDIFFRSKRDKAVDRMNNRGTYYDIRALLNDFADIFQPQKINNINGLKEVSSCLMKMGYDGIRFYDHRIVVIFDPKKIKILNMENKENVGKKILIKEEQQQRLKLAPFIYKAIASKRTSLGDNPAFPPYGNFGFEYDVVKKKYEEVDEIINNCIKNGELESKDPEYLLTVLSKKVEECKRLEEPIRPQLEKICENIINMEFSVPNDTVILNCKLVGKIKPKKGMRILPEGDDEDNGYDFEDVDEVNLTNKVILKRRFINSMIQGIAYWLSTDLDSWHDTVVELDKRIWGLWYEIKHITDYLLFTKEEKISEKNPMQMSYVEVTLGKNGKKTIIDAQGTIFPYLLRDTFRGFLELFSSHGLPEDNQKAMYIIRKADFLVAEPWDLRLGMGIIDMLHDSLTKKFQTDLLFQPNRIPFFFTELCSMPTDEFNDVMQNFLLGTNKGKLIAKEIDSKIAHDIDYQKFKDKIQQKNVDKSLISDGDFSKEELDDYVIEEDMDEMMAYHGSSHNFDKFNHKKYLNTGMGSQVFGWGTYITSDPKVADGYSDAAKETIYDESIINEENIFNKFIEIYGLDEHDATMHTDKLMSYINYEHGIDYAITYFQDIAKTSGIKERTKQIFAMYLNVLNSLNLKKTDSYVYEVEIPDDNGANYIDWYEHFPSEFMKRVLYGFLKIHNKYIMQIADRNYPFKCDLYQKIMWMKENPDNAERMIEILSNDDTYDEFFSHGMYTKNPDTEGKNVYNKLRELFNSDKAASLFLMQCGFDGIKYPAGTMWGKPDGASEEAYNYVIFDANKVKIVNKTVK